MTASFTPNGFDRERKDRAARCEAKWDTATYAAGALGVAAAAVFPPAAGGLILVAALGGVMKYPFTRARLDPARHDYFVPAEPRAALADPSVFYAGEGSVELGPPLIVFSLDRAAAYLDAMIDAAERALGAFQDGSQAGMEARLAEARLLGRRALSSLRLAAQAGDWLLSADTPPVTLREVGRREGATIHELIESSRELTELLAACGPLGTQALTLRPFPAEIDVVPGPEALTEALKDSVEWVSSVLAEFPDSAQAFVAPRRPTPASAPPENWLRDNGFTAIDVPSRDLRPGDVLLKNGREVQKVGALSLLFAGPDAPPAEYVAHVPSIFARQVQRDVGATILAAFAGHPTDARHLNFALIRSRAKQLTLTYENVERHALMIPELQRWLASAALDASGRAVTWLNDRRLAVVTAVVQTAQVSVVATDPSGAIVHLDVPDLKSVVRGDVDVAATPASTTFTVSEAVAFGLQAYDLVLEDNAGLGISAGEFARQAWAPDESLAVIT